MRNINLSNVADSNNNKPTAGGYVLEITNVRDVPMNESTGKGDYLIIDYDFADGEFKDYYYGMMKSLGFWGGHFIRSYKPKALGMFKAFINELKRDNPEFDWDDDAENDENRMVGCRLGAVLGEEEYRGNDGSIKKRLYVDKITSIDNIMNNKYKVPFLKSLEGTTGTSAGFVDTTDQIAADVPF